MARTTPPRPVNMAEVFPELAGMTRTTTRLHPRRGAPTVEQSSVGGPLLWPAEEPWPRCHDCHQDRYRFSVPLTPLHEIRAARGLATDEPGPLRAEESEALRRSRQGLRIGEFLPNQVPLLPVAQLYAAEIPDLACPPDTDLLQVLWCPFDHEDDYTPNVWLYWRRASDIEQVLLDPPEPALVGNDDYVPRPCVLHPERVTEFPPSDQLPEDLSEQILQWEAGKVAKYQYDLSVPPGWKVGGWNATWTFRDPEPLHCEECGAGVGPLMAVDDREWDGGSRSWRPVEDNEKTDRESRQSVQNSTQIDIGRGYTLQIYCCSRDRTHPCVTAMQ
ncbi:hypothetical protein SAMN04487820_103375 [Actinopolyspora mzabensis]|uniref:DUF1963 domain-containing protein n=1 Tax=Actinopolyspora mzabensis TaxID=995066 RepID=A0A1G8YDY2_ACTMZ|nr:hypothetical protein [Actinopolyspora mzabensis]SDK00425.1 hypothetical protein SAMN04487820_103375 [Actinopolyspora mzabensis]